MKSDGLHFDTLLLVCGKQLDHNLSRENKYYSTIKSQVAQYYGNTIQRKNHRIIRKNLLSNSAI